MQNPPTEHPQGHSSAIRGSRHLAGWVATQSQTHSFTVFLLIWLTDQLLTFIFASSSYQLYHTGTEVVMAILIRPWYHLENASEPLESHSLKQTPEICQENQRRCLTLARGGWWQRKSSNTRAPEQPSSSVEHILKGRGTRPSRQMSALQGVLMFNDSL